MCIGNGLYIKAAMTTITAGDACAGITSSISGQVSITTTCVDTVDLAFVTCYDVSSTPAHGWAITRSGYIDAGCKDYTVSRKIHWFIIRAAP